MYALSGAAESPALTFQRVLRCALAGRSYDVEMIHEKSSVLVVSLIAAAMTVGGCSRSNDNKASAKPTTTDATSRTPAPATASTSRPTGAATCQPPQLRVKLTEDPGGGAAGSDYSHLIFTNIGGKTCLMTGWPGVSYVGSSNGTQLGSSADRTGSATIITLKPGAVAQAQLKESAAGNLSPDCIITPADGLRVYSPNTKAAVFIAHSTQACASLSKHLMTIGPVELK